MMIGHELILGSELEMSLGRYLEWIVRQPHPLTE